MAYSETRRIIALPLVAHIKAEKEEALQEV
jgi:hypothetical protein